MPPTSDEPKFVEVRNTDTDRVEQVREDVVDQLLASSSNWVRVEAGSRSAKSKES